MHNFPTIFQPFPSFSGEIHRNSGGIHRNFKILNLKSLSRRNSRKTTEIRPVSRFRWLPEFLSGSETLTLVSSPGERGDERLAILFFLMPVSCSARSCFSLQFHSSTLGNFGFVVDRCCIYRAILSLGNLVVGMSKNLEPVAPDLSQKDYCQ